MTRILPPHQWNRASSVLQSITILVIGHGGTRILRANLTRFFQSRGGRVETSLGFDHQTESSVCQVGVNNKESGRKPERAVDLLIGLCNSSLRYASRLRAGGLIVLDTSRVGCPPAEEDKDAILVPAKTLAQAAAEAGVEKPLGKEVENLDDSVIFGATLSAMSNYPSREELKTLFQSTGQEPFVLFVQATYEGYDWVQETMMRGKSLGRRPAQ